MPVIDRPESNIARNAVLRNSKIRKDQVPPIPNNPYTPGTVAWLDLFQPQYKAKFDVVSAALHTQTSLTAQVKHAKKLAVFYEEDFVLALQRAIRRELFPKTDRSYYGIPVDSRETLKVSTETQIIDANEVLTTGETNRTTAGGAPISFPSIGDVNNMVNNFISLNNSQAPAKLNFDDKQGELSALNPEADRLILKLWNETETAFDTGDKADMRRRAREWGVVYKPKKGEALSPDDFSIAGMITETGTGIKLGDVEVKVIQTGYVYVSKSNGDYLVPKQDVGIYSLEFKKTGYAVKLVNNVVVTAGEITTLNVELSPEVALGTVSGNVKEAGMNRQGVNISVAGFPLLMAVTDINGNFTINNVPAGAQTLTAKLPPPSPALPQTQPVTVLAGAEVNVGFNF